MTPGSSESSASKRRRSGKPSSVLYGGTARSAWPEREVWRETLRARPGALLLILFTRVPRAGLWPFVAKGVGCARHQSAQREVIDAHPTGRDHTGFDPLCATVFQERLGARPGADHRSYSGSRKKDRGLRP